MVTATLSDADVFGSSAPSGGSVLSDADVFGSAKGTKPTTRQPRSDASIALGGAGAGTKAVARSLADFGDMFVSIPGMVMGTAADVSSRIQSFAEGTDPRAAGRIAKGVREGVTSQFSPPIFRQLAEAAIHAVAPDKKDLTNSDVQDGMKLLTDGIEKGGKWVEQKTKGLITAETFDSLVNEGMALGGLKGSGALAEKAVPRPKPTEQAKPPVEPTGPETPTSTAAKRDVRADVEAATGVNRMAPKEAQAAQKARREQARSAFKEDPQYADYLKNYADEEARLRSLEPDPISSPGGVSGTGPRAPRTGLRDAVEEKPLPRGDQPKVETGAPEALDSALSKVRQGRAFDLTAEERIRLKNAGPTPKFERGSASTADMAALAAFAGGTAAMAAWSSDPSVVTDIVAGLVASAATRIRPRMLADTVRSMRAAKPLASIGAIAIDRESNIRLAGIDTTNTVRRVAKLVPSESRREAIHEALDTGKPKGLSPNERAAYDILRAEYDRLAQLGLDADTLKNVRVNYATHMWKMDADIFEHLFGRRQGFGTSPNTPYSLERAFATMAEGEKAGLKPVSKDAAFVFATYANSLISAVENGKMLKTLREVRTPGGDLLVQKTSEAPHQYVTIQNPQMRGLAVHPEIAPQMRFIFENPSAAGVGAALEIVADVTKRSAVSASLFHVKALVDVLTAAVPGKAKYFAGAAVGAAVGYGVATTAGDEHALREAALAGLAGYVGPRLKAYATGRSAFLDELHKGSNSPFIVRAVKSGLVFGAEKGPLVVDDAGRRFYDAMQLVQKEADRIASPVGIKAGKGVEAYIKANHWMDDMLWGRLHPGMKLEVWSKTSDTIRQASIERNAKSPKSRILSQAEADEIASRYTNDLFGGLNWTRMAMEAKTRLGRVVAQELLSPKGRRAMRIMMFAPDWTISTARSALAAIDKDLVNPLKWGSVAKGMFQPITRGDLARQYAARSALYYLTVGDAINYSMSGHHLWENDDKIGWSFIDWGDGRRMQFSKHIMEVPHWFDHPVKQAVGKLGYVPKEAANQLLGTDYLAPQMGKQGQVFAGPRMKDTSPFGRVKHAAHGLVPIPFQGEMNDSSAWGFAGMPIYGQTKEQRERAKRERDDRKRRERR